MYNKWWQLRNFFYGPLKLAINEFCCHNIQAQIKSKPNILGKKLALSDLFYLHTMSIINMLTKRCKSPTYALDNFHGGSLNNFIFLCSVFSTLSLALPLPSWPGLWLCSQWGLWGRRTSLPPPPVPQSQPYQTLQSASWLD